MKKKIDKNLVLKGCIIKQEELIASFESRINELKTDAFEQNQSPSQTESRSTTKIDLLRNFEKELAFAKMEMDYLKTIDSAIVSTKAEPGAMVITNHLNFFIAVSSEKVEIDGDVVFGISTKAPIYSVMQGLQKGAAFSYNDTNYEIEDLY